ncbi:MAG: hypothetical protein LQ348_001719 [Seirophora lacunosa]|nr:MAG: hypothetical protein LQ344_005070 [Seirophora lacunosa]KAI4200880.1 MAG: hypothetical protein LQ348_001719 [Seirophora lacunosa]
MVEESQGNRELGEPSGTSDASAGKTYDSFNYPATSENINSLPGVNQGKVSKQQPNAGLFEALKSIQLEDFKEVHKKPCTREGFLTGIGAGFGIGGVRAILGAPIFTACSWAVGAFVFGSFAMHEYCQQKRRTEKAGIQRINAALDEKKVEIERKREETRRARRKAKEEGDRQKAGR